MINSATWQISFCECLLLSCHVGRSSRRVWCFGAAKSGARLQREQPQQLLQLATDVSSVRSGVAKEGAAKMLMDHAHKQIFNFIIAKNKPWTLFQLHEILINVSVKEIILKCCTMKPLNVKDRAGTLFFSFIKNNCLPDLLKNRF